MSDTQTGQERGADGWQHDRCGTCDFWEKPGTKYGEVPGVGRCKRAVMYWSATEWRKGYTERVLRPEYADALMFVQDASDYQADLFTLPNFGCVQHEPIAAGAPTDAIEMQHYIVERSARKFVGARTAFLCAYDDHLREVEKLEQMKRGDK